jgi:TP901 family phage tail tape measure protein
VALDAGSVYAVLEGRFHPGGFLAFDGAMKRSEGHTTGLERALLRTTSRGSTALRTLGTAAGYGAAGGIAALSVAIVGSVKAAASFESALERVHTQAGASQREVDNMRGALLKLGPEVGKAPKDLADALFHVESAGFRGAKALSLVRNSAKLAAIGNSDLESTTNAVIAVMKSEIGGVKGASDAIAQMNAIVGSGNMKMQDLTGAISTGLLSAAKSVGLTFRDVGAALDLMTSKGTPAEEAATRLRMTFSLMAAPTGQAQKALKTIGLSSTQLAEDMRKPQGLVVAIDDLRKHLDDSGKSAVAQNAILSHAFGGGRSSAAIMQMVQNTDQLAKNFDAIGKNATPHVLADAWKKTEQTTSEQFDKLKASISAAAIIIGSALLPELTKGAHKLTEFLQKAQESGDLQKIGHDLAHGLEEGAKAIPTIIDGLHLIFSAAGFGVHAIEGLINAFGGLSVVGPLLLGAAAGLAALRVAQSVVPVLVGVASGLNDIALAARAGGAAFAAETLISMINPATALAAAFAGLGAAIALTLSRESEEEQLAKAVAQAKRDEATATNQLRDAEDHSADATLGAQRAHLSLFQARQRLSEVTKQYGTHSAQYKDALISEKQAGLDWVEAHKRMTEAAKKLDDHQRNVSVKTTTDLTALTKKVTDAQENYTQAVKHDGAQSVAAQAAAHKLAEAKKAEAAAFRSDQAAMDRGSVSAVDLARKMAGVAPIAQKNVGAVSLLTSVLNRIPAAKRTKLEADDQDVLAKIGKVVPQLIRYGQMDKAAKLLADSSNAEQGLHRVLALLSQFQSKDVTLTTHTRTLGGGSGGVNSGPGHHARGARVDRPEVFQAGEDFNREYIIPVEGPWRGRGLDLWMQAGHDLGIPGFKKGKKPKKHHHAHAARHVPAHRDPLSLPLDTFQNDERSAKGHFDDAQRTLDQLNHQANLKGKTNAAQRAAAKKKLPAQKKRVEQFKALWRKRELELKEAKKYAAKISKQEDLAEIARNAMELADKQDDQSGFDKAKGDRSTALGTLRDLYTEALKHIRPGTPYYRNIQKALGQTLNDIQDTSTDVNATETPEAPSLLTDDQQKQLDDIEAAISLDQVNTPDDTTDDVRDTKSLVGFWEGILANLQSSGAPSSLIKEAADDVLSARNDLKSLTDIVGPNGTSPDLQAQLDQANRRADVATETARIATGALDVFSGAGDLGFGPGFASGRGVHIEVNTLHPGDPRTLDAIGRAATAGQSLRTTRQSPRVRVGL